LAGAELEAATFASPTFEKGRRHGRGFLALGPKAAGMDKPSILEQFLEANKIRSSMFSIIGGSPLVKFGDTPKNGITPPMGPPRPFWKPCEGRC
jgi:hypothetical protein